MNLRMIRRISKRSTHQRFNHVAIITSGKRVLAVGYNRGEIHAEEVAIRRLAHVSRNNRNIPSSLTLTSLMFKRKNGNIGESFPCNDCLQLINKAKIRWVTYVENGVIKTV
jgi:deoxycytidylate deaminase